MLLVFFVKSHRKLRLGRNVWVKIGYDEINARKDVRENFLFIKKNEVGKERKNYRRSKGSVRRNKQTWSSNTDSARPFAELDQSSLANGRAGSTRVRLRLVLVTPLPKIALNSFLFRLDRRYRWNFTILKS